MRLLYIFFFITCFSFSQTNEVLINQALQTAETQNIQTKSQAVKALQASGLSESQAGVDRISIGILTHSISAVDFKLEI